MSSLRYRLERELWAADVRVGVLPSDTDSPQVTTYPVFAPNGVSLADVARALPDVSGRLGLPALRVSWRDDGLLALECPKARRQTVSLNVLKVDSDAAIPWLLGITTSGRALLTDVTKMPHGLLCGSTGSGKSNSVSASLCYLLTNRSPLQVRTVLLDPKQVDLAPFAKTPHNMAHVTDMKAAEGVLQALIDDMNQRMAMFSRAGVKDVASYNAKAKQPLPRVLVVFDEFAAAMDINGKALEPLLMVLLQQARASGIHFLLTLQRPDDKVLPTRMRNNLPVRVSFRLADASASRLVLNDAAAVGLLGSGDGLLQQDGVLTRFQAPLASDNDIAKAVTKTRAMPQANYQLEGLSDVAISPLNFEGMSRYDAAVSLCRQSKWLRSQDLVDVGICDSQAVGKQVISQLEKHGILGAYDPSRKARPVIQPVTDNDSIAGKKRVTHDNDGYNGLSRQGVN